MGGAARLSVPLRLWPHPYEIARLRGVPAGLPQLAVAGPPVALVVGNGEVSLLAPTETVTALAELVEVREPGWRAITLDAVLPLDTVGVLARACAALAEIGVPVTVFASHGTDHLLVPAGQLGRAVAALSQAGFGETPLRREDASPPPGSAAGAGHHPHVGRRLGKR